ncbi:MAG TPA: ribosome-binding factor A, partial [Kofleriaceae bacterium]|nr:ribosome-binding factor A [Kofleriaceae bacterium]
MNLRHVRVARTLRQILAELILRELKDPRVEAGGRITLTQVELSRDMGQARVYVEIAAGGAAGDAALAALR